MKELNLDDYEKIISHKNQKLRFKVMESGKALVGSGLLKKINSKYIEIYISHDAASIILKESENQDFRVCKSGYITNNEIAETIVYKGVILPAIYTMTWNDKFGLWNGNLAQRIDMKKIIKRKK